MATKANSPLLVEDYKRAIRAAKWAGWKVVRVIVGENIAIELVADDTYLQKLAEGQPPAPNADEAEREVKPDW